MDQNNRDALVSLTADIVSAYVTKNAVPRADLGTLIGSVHGSLTALAIGDVPISESAPVPAVPIKKSVTDEYLICLEDGKKFKSLKRHIGVHYNLTPDEYRQKWNLPASYPMVAPAYAAARSMLARKMGLGRKPAAKPAPKRGRSKA